MKLPLYQIDAFTDRLFGGNPAAVIPMNQWLPDPVLQAIAAENNLSETAFVVACEGSTSDFELRWFTPTNEVDLCGHATLATAWVLFHEIGFGGDRVLFSSRGGELAVSREGERLTLDFPARPPAPVPLDPQVLKALGIVQAEAMLLARDLLVVLESEEQVQRLTPDFAALAEFDHFGVCVTAPGRDCDFVSRFFAPRQGINEDPVTGSAHCSLTPYWAERLQRGTLDARQLSQRSGSLHCRLDGDRVLIGGDARCYLRGEILLTDHDDRDAAGR